MRTRAESQVTLNKTEEQQMSEKTVESQDSLSENTADSSDSNKENYDKGNSNTTATREPEPSGEDTGKQEEEEPCADRHANQASHSINFTDDISAMPQLERKSPVPEPMDTEAGCPSPPDLSKEKVTEEDGQEAEDEASSSEEDDTSSSDEDDDDDEDSGSDVEKEPEEESGKTDKASVKDAESSRINSKGIAEEKTTAALPTVSPGKQPGFIPLIPTQNTSPQRHTSIVIHDSSDDSSDTGSDDSSGSDDSDTSDEDEPIGSPTKPLQISPSEKELLKDRMEKNDVCVQKQSMSEDSNYTESTVGVQKQSVFDDSKVAESVGGESNDPGNETCTNVEDSEEIKIVNESNSQEPKLSPISDGSHNKDCKNETEPKSVSAVNNNNSASFNKGPMPKRVELARSETEMDTKENTYKNDKPGDSVIEPSNSQSEGEKHGQPFPPLSLENTSVPCPDTQSMKLPTSVTVLPAHTDNRLSKSTPSITVGPSCAGFPASIDKVETVNQLGLESPPSMNSSDLNNSSVETTPSQSYPDCAQIQGSYCNNAMNNSPNYMEAVNNQLTSPINSQITSPTQNQTFTLPNPSPGNPNNFNIPIPSPSNNQQYNTMPQPSPNAVYGVPQPSPNQSTNFNIPNPSPGGNQTYNIPNPSPGSGMPTPSPTNSNHSFSMATPSPNAPSSGNFPGQNPSGMGSTSGQNYNTMCSNSATVNSFNPPMVQQPAMPSACAVSSGAANNPLQQPQQPQGPQQQGFGSQQRPNSCSLAKLQQLTKDIPEFSIQGEQMTPPPNLTPPPVHTMSPPPSQATMHRNNMTPPSAHTGPPHKYQRQRSSQKSPAPNVTVNPNMSFPSNVSIQPSAPSTNPVLPGYNMYMGGYPRMQQQVNYLSNAGMFNRHHQPNLPIGQPPMGMPVHPQHMQGQPNNPMYHSMYHLPTQPFSMNGFIRR